MNDKKIKIGAVVGCTASGKTSLAIELARRLDGEIICCDSMQIYKGMDIGTAKPTSEECAAVPHHLFDICSPEQTYSCADFVRDATAAVEEISSRGKLPIFCGGTGLYLDRFLRGGNSDEAQNDENLRRELEDFARECGVDALHGRLRELDAESADAIHKNNVKRVIRAIEICTLSGRKKSEIDRENSALTDKYDYTVIYPFYNDREILYERINRRVDMMMEAGLVEETRRLLEGGVFEKSQTASQAIGYKEIIPYIRGEASLYECVELLKTATRKYAKRQMTWFNSKPYAQKILMDDENGAKTFEDIVNISEKLF
ncbi:MAG: tRNA (adenosine(37)-N6)-dimethylallyltransferase MiaA [Ruminococcaceae bacterium]|nr:tRNA (adenosine(37)-N6)-dimethylallyltransferase MiaA [Oscillospiraceae bacterium]